jgi:hypothetical protein
MNETAGPRITTRASTSRRVAVTDQMTTIKFERGWNVYADGKRLPMLWVGQTDDGRMYGIQGAAILVVTGPREASRVAYSAYARADKGNLW